MQNTQRLKDLAAFIARRDGPAIIYNRILQAARRAKVEKSNKPAGLLLSACQTRVQRFRIGRIIYFGVLPPPLLVHTAHAV
jgi:hypothetical protein